MTALAPARYVWKDESSLMRAVGFVLRPFNGRFMTHYWTTIGQTIYVPTRVERFDEGSRVRWEVDHREVLSHEDDHRAFFATFGVPLTAFLYLLFPLPIGFAWGRWVVERRAFLINARSRPPEERMRYVDEHVLPNLCGSAYLWTWPRSWAREWFAARV